MTTRLPLSNPMFRVVLGLLLITATLLASASDATAEPASERSASGPASGSVTAPEFNIDVMSVLSKAGCNAGTCHGNLNGKGGFKLSLRGQDSQFDFNSLVLASRGRRINTTAPRRSLFLQKASGDVAHRGGIRFDIDSREYRQPKSSE